jgi:hypothetical protein
MPEYRQRPQLDQDDVVSRESSAFPRSTLSDLALPARDLKLNQGFNYRAPPPRDK